MGIFDLLRTRPLSAEEHFDRGLVSARRGDFARAIGEWRAAARMDASNAKAHYNLGLAYYKKDREHLLDETIREFRLACTLDPEDNLASRNLAAAVAEKEQPNGTAQLADEPFAETA